MNCYHGSFVPLCSYARLNERRLNEIRGELNVALHLLIDGAHSSRGNKCLGTSK